MDALKHQGEGVQRSLFGVLFQLEQIAMLGIILKDLLGISSFALRLKERDTFFLT